MNNFLLLTDYSFVSTSKTSLSSPVSSVGYVKTSAFFSESYGRDAVVGGGSEGEASVNVENVTWLERQLLLIVFTFTKID